MLRDICDADLVYVNVFGERVAHLHFNLAPHREGDALQGGRAMLVADAGPIDCAELESIAARIETRLS